MHVTAVPDGDSGAAHGVVRDERAGIEPEHQEAVFHLFRQLDPHGSGKEGAGMGLALCRRIAERHDGAIWIESSPAREPTCFCLSPVRVNL